MPPVAYRLGLRGIAPPVIERRKNNSAQFDIATVLELNLDRYRTKQAMLTYLTALLYTAETGQLYVRHPEYVNAMWRALELVDCSTGVVEAVASVRGFQAFPAPREMRPALKVPL
jgi:hypothetical protein